MSFESFINDISPGNTSEVALSGNEIRETIQGTSTIISSSYLTGSYIRRTKIDPIDDLDIFFKIDFGNTGIEDTINGRKIYLIGDAASHKLIEYSVYENGKYYVSPIKLINHIGKIVKSSYATTNEQSRNGECYTVYLSSKDLTIDCVPYAGVKGYDYELIPSGGNNLYWKKTNPTKDKDNINELNDMYDGKLKGVIKLMKYWNKNKNTSVKFKSYILECLIYYAFGEKCNVNMNYTTLLTTTIDYIKNNVKMHKNIYDLPRYGYMHYSLNTDQEKRINEKLDTMIAYLRLGEEQTIKYLKN